MEDRVGAERDDAKEDLIKILAESQDRHCAIFTFRLKFYTETQRFYFLLIILERERTMPITTFETDVLYLLLFLCLVGYFDFAGVILIIL